MRRITFDRVCWYSGSLLLPNFQRIHVPLFAGSPAFPSDGRKSMAATSRTAVTVTAVRYRPISLSEPHLESGASYSRSRGLLVGTTEFYLFAAAVRGR